jgi:hypothetical protein
MEGATERRVSRTTYAFDLTTARPLLEGLAPEDADEEFDEERDTDDFDDDFDAEDDE